MIRVVYFSRGGNTRRLAEAVAGEVGTQAESVAELMYVQGADLLFVGASAYAGDIGAEMREYLAKLTPGDVGRVAVFGSAAGKKSMRDVVAAVLEPNGIPVEKEAFLCKGAFLIVNRGKPDAADCAGAREFARKIAGIG